MISGPIPTELGRLSALDKMYLYRNQLTSSLPSSLGLLGLLDEIQLFDNILTGSLPTEIGKMSSLRIMYLNDNRFSGTIPWQLGLLTRLRAHDGSAELYLHDNEGLCGSIPDNVYVYNISGRTIGSACPSPPPIPVSPPLPPRNPNPPSPPPSPPHYPSPPQSPPPHPPPPLSPALPNSPLQYPPTSPALEPPTHSLYPSPVFDPPPSMPNKDGGSSNFLIVIISAVLGSLVAVLSIVAFWLGRRSAKFHAAPDETTGQAIGLPVWGDHQGTPVFVGKG